MLQPSYFPKALPAPIGQNDLTHVKAIGPLEVRNEESRVKNHEREVALSDFNTAVEVERPPRNWYVGGPNSEGWKVAEVARRRGFAPEDVYRTGGSSNDR